MVSHLKFWSHNLHSWCDRIVVLGFSVLFFSQFECKVIQSSHNLVYPSLWILSLRISHIWRFWLLEDLESSTKNNSVKISSQFLKFSVFRAQFSGSHYGNSQFRSEINRIKKSTGAVKMPSEILLTGFIILSDWWHFRVR